MTATRVTIVFATAASVRSSLLCFLLSLCWRHSSFWSTSSSPCSWSTLRYVKHRTAAAQRVVYYPAIRRIGRDTKFTVAFFLCMSVRLRISQSGLYTDRREILHGGSATSRTDIFPILGDSPRDGRVFGVNRAPYGGICSLLKHLYYTVLFPV